MMYPQLKTEGQLHSDMGLKIWEYEPVGMHLNLQRISFPVNLIPKEKEALHSAQDDKYN